MLLQNRNIVTLTIAILGALKLILQSFGLNVINDQEIDSIANGVAAVVAIVGVFMTHTKSSQSPGAQPPASGTPPTGSSDSQSNTQTPSS